MKIIVVMLITLVGLLQYELWFATGGLYSAYRLQQGILEKQVQNAQLAKRNEVMRANIDDLKHGKDALEEHARYDLGMIKKGEVFYQVVRETR